MTTIKKPFSLPNRILFGIILGVLVYFGLEIGAHATVDERATLLGYSTMLAGALFATALPGALIPDGLLSLHQLVNTPPEELLRSQLRRWMPWMSILAPPVACIAFFDPSHFTDSFGSKAWLLTSTLIGIAAVGIYSFCFYFTIGSTAQRWQEGTAGSGYDKLVDFIPYLTLPLPRGLVPAVTATARVFTLSVALVLIQLSLVHRFGPMHAFWPAALALGWSLYKLNRLYPRFDGAYYPTNAFYREIFQHGRLRSAERTPIMYDAVYWAPRRWRSHTWMILLQLDRALPIGRFLTAGMFILWILVWRGVQPMYVSAFLGLLVTAKNMASLKLSRQDLMPPEFRSMFQSTASWSATYFFVNVRWTAPIFIGLAFLAWIHPGFSMQAAALWTLLDVFLSFVFALFLTYANTLQSQERIHG